MRYSLVSLIFIISLGFSLTLDLIEPSGTYHWGNIPVSAKLLDDSGNPIPDATVYAQANGQKIQLAWNSSSQTYQGTLQIIKMGDYTVTAWAVVNGTNVSDYKTITVDSSKIDITILAPKGEYAPGGIPVKLEILVGGEERQNVTAKVDISNDTGTVWNSTLEYPYNALVNLDQGNYRFKAWVEADNSNATAFSNFTVSESYALITIVNPKPGSYSGKIPIDVDLWKDGEFIHHAYVWGEAKSGNKTVTRFRIPEAQYHYSTQIELEPGYYNIIISANISGNIISKSVNITVPGYSNGTIIPGNKELVVNEIWTNLQRRYYSTGQTGIFAVSLVDSATGTYITTQGNVTCCVFHEKKKECKKMEFKDKPIPHYELEYTFNSEDWYEAEVNITIPGYKPVTHRFPPIKVGKPEIKPPAGYQEIENYIFTIISPESQGTYPANESLGIRVQLLDEEGMPITDANVTAILGNNTFPLDYDINGEYYAKTEPLEPGSYNLVIAVQHNNTTFSRNVSFLVTQRRLEVRIASPEENANITNKTVRIAVEVLDESGDMVPDADVKATLVSPKTGSHTVDLVRNLETGYYTIDYQLDSPGSWKVKAKASKKGYLDGSAESSFKASFEEKERFTEKDIIAGAVLLAALLVIALIMRAIV